MILRVALLILIFLSSQPVLAGVGACDDLGGEPATASVDFEQDIQPIFNDRCVGCHTAGHSTGLDLQAGASYGLLVNVPSSQDGSWLRVDPSSPANSLLFRKINCEDPPVGDRMPLGGPPLPLAEQALIRDWIAQGAGDRIFFDGFEHLLPPLPAVSQTGLVDWFNPDHGLFLDGDGRVAEWTNLAAAGRSTGGSTAATPVDAVAGRRMIRFDSPVEGGHLGYPSPGAQTLDQGYSVFVVFRLNEPLADGHSFPRFWRGANDTHAFFLRRSTGEVEVKADPLAVAARPTHPFGDRYATGDFAILTARLTQASQQLYFNGLMVDGSDSPIAAYTIDNSLFQIGNSVRGDIGDVLVYDHSATLADLDVTGQGLAKAYGTTWQSIVDPGMRLPPIDLVTAHRGNSSQAPENTLVAMTSAVGFAGMTEFDAQLAADGVIVLMHDATVDRTTNGSGRVDEIAYEGGLELLDAGSWFSPAFAGEPIPTMAEAITEALSLGFVPVIEAKLAGPGDAAAYHAELESLEVLDKILLDCFNWDFIANFRDLSPQTRLGALGSGQLTQATLDTIKNTGADYLHWAHGSITAQSVDLVHANGLKLIVYTVNNESRMIELLEMGVDSITTDYPAVLAALLQTFPSDL